MAATLSDGSGAERRESLSSQIDALSRELAHLRTLAHAFERWHQDMIALTEHSHNINVAGDDLTDLARNLIIVSLNAAIEAARAGSATHGFVVVAGETKNLSRRVQELTGEINKHLHKSLLLTTATFQDIQAGGKLMMAAVSGLEAMSKKLREGLD
jgi:methyl-accepting chemotaxis protein